MNERHRQDAIDVIKTEYTYGMSNAGYVNIIIKATLINWPMIHLLDGEIISSLYLDSSLSVLVMAV